MRDLKQVFRRRTVPMCIAGLVAISAISYLVVMYDVSTETRMQCVLTGVDRIVTTRFGLEVSDEVVSNDVSRWAEKYGNAEITPGLCGWQTVDWSETRWFVPTIRETHRSPRLVVQVLHERSLSSTDDFEGRLLQEYYRQINARLAADNSVDYLLEGFLSHCPPMIVPDAKAVTIVFYHQTPVGDSLMFEVTSAEDRDAVVNCIRNVRWIPTDIDPNRTVSFVPHDFEIMLTDNSGKLHTYRFYWNYDCMFGDHDGSVWENVPQLRAQITAITVLSSHPKGPATQ
jgi:hypothetical protein